MAVTNMKIRMKRRDGAYRVPSATCEFHVVPVAVVIRAVKASPHTRMSRPTVRNRLDKPDAEASAPVYRPFVLDPYVPYSLRMTWTGEARRRR